MIKAIYGKVKLNRHTCPNCGNSLEGIYRRRTNIITMNQSGG